jgi:Putative adhesin
VTVRQFDTPGDVSVRVKSKSGEVRLIAHDLPTTEVEVTPLEAAADEAAAQTSVECRPNGAGYLVEVDVPSEWGSSGGGFLRRVMSLAGEGAKVRVVIRCPAGSGIDVSSASATISTVGTFGTVKAKTASGDVTLGPVTGPVQVGTASGDVTFEGIEGNAKVDTVSGVIKGERVAAVAKLESASGDVTLQVATERLTVQTVSGDVKVGETATDCQVKTTSGDVSLSKATSGRVELQAVSGDLRVGVAAGTLLHVEGESVSGDLSSEIPLDDAPPEDATGAGGPELSLAVKTVSGDVSIRRA